MPLFSRKKLCRIRSLFFGSPSGGNFAPKKEKKNQRWMRVVMGIDGWCGPVGAGCLWPLDEIYESSPKFVMQEQSAWTENVTETWTEKKHEQKRK